MLKPTFVIFIETASGEVVEAFTWCRDAASGIARAKSEAKDFGYGEVHAWATPV